MQALLTPTNTVILSDNFDGSALGAGYTATGHVVIALDDAVLLPGATLELAHDLQGWSNVRIQFTRRASSPDESPQPYVIEWETSDGSGVLESSAGPTRWGDAAFSLPESALRRDFRLRIRNTSDAGLVRVDALLIDGVDGDNCADNPCQNGGTCADGVGSFTCTCSEAWTGPTCVVSAACEPNPCANDGVCSGAGVCECPAGWTGSTCETDVNECLASSVVCGIDNCVNTLGSYTCVEPSPGPVVFEDAFDGAALGAQYEGSGKLSGEALLLYGGETLELPLSTVGLKQVRLAAIARVNTFDGTAGTQRISYFDGKTWTPVLELNATAKWTTLNTRLPRETWANAAFRVRFECTGTRGIACRFDNLAVRAEDQEVFTQLTLGSTTTCGLRPDASAICWGENNNYADPNSMLLPPSGAFTQLALASQFGCGLRADGSASCWGLRNGDYVSCEANGEPAFCSAGAQPSDAGFASIVAGVGHVCALRTDGVAACTGSNSQGQTAVPAGEVFVELAAGDYHTCGLRADGSASCWGAVSGGEAGPEVDVPADEAFGQLTAGSYHTCGLRGDGSVLCWGQNTYGQLDAPAGEVFTALAAGGFHTCGLRADGRAVCWGHNEYGSSDAPETPSFTALSAGWIHTCGLTSSGYAVCWGYNQFGQATAP